MSQQESVLDPKVLNLIERIDEKFEFLPFLVFVIDKELVELLPLELELIFGVLLDGLFVGDGVVLGRQVGLERHHGRLDGVVRVRGRRGAAAGRGCRAVASSVASGVASTSIVVVAGIAAIVAVAIIPVIKRKRVSQ